MKKVVIVGPGGLGGTVAALLGRGGACEVTVVGRPGAHIETIQKSGLRLTGLQEFTVQIDAVDEAKRIPECDVLIFTVKAQDTRAALQGTAHIHVRDLAVSLQNGVVKDDLLVEAFGKEKVIGAVAIVAGERPEPGVVNWTYDGGTQFGELDGERSERVASMADMFQQAGLNAHTSGSIQSSTWTKMVAWIPIGLISTLSRMDNAGTLSHRLLATEFVGMVRELSALAAKKGIPLIDFGPYHVQTWCQGSLEEAVELVMTSPLASSKTTHSALQDIQKGNPTEFSACVGPMIEDAGINSVPVAAVQVMYSTLMGLEKSLGH